MGLLQIVKMALKSQVEHNHFFFLWRL